MGFEIPTSQLKSLNSANQFSFACPIFRIDVQLRGCVHLHDLHMVGRGPETRRGCQAAMSSNKCPVWHMVQLMRGGRDEWHASTPEVGTLGQDVISRVARVQTDAKTIADFDVPPREAQLLLDANRMWEADSSSPAKPRRAPKSVPPVTTSSDDEVTKAARSGDMAAALSRAAADEQNASGSTRTPRPKRKAPASA